MNLTFDFTIVLEKSVITHGHLLNSCALA